MGTPETPNKPKTRLAAVWVILIVSVVVATGIATVFALAVIPVTHSYSFTVQNPPNEVGVEEQAFPGGASVTGSWQWGGGGAVTLTITDPAGGAVYSGGGTSGSFSLTSVDASYTFTVYSAAGDYGPTAVSGSFGSPWL